MSWWSLVCLFVGGSLLLEISEASPPTFDLLSLTTVPGLSSLQVWTQLTGRILVTLICKLCKQWFLGHGLYGCMTAPLLPVRSIAICASHTKLVSSTVYNWKNDFICLENFPFILTFFDFCVAQWLITPWTILSAFFFDRPINIGIYQLILVNFETLSLLYLPPPIFFFFFSSSFNVWPIDSIAWLIVWLID